MKTFEEQLSKIKKFYQSEQHQQELKKAKKLLSEKPIILYGAGSEGLEFLNVLRFCGINPLCFCDKNRVKTEVNVEMEIISPKLLLQPEFCQANILISSSMYKIQIEKDLEQLGVSLDRVLERSNLFRLCLSIYEEKNINKNSFNLQYFILFHAISEMINGKNDALLLGYEKTYYMLGDDKSRQILIERINLGLNGTLITRDPLETVYFDPQLVILSETEVFVDCGMFTADTADAFFKYVSNKYTHYYGFEPHQKNLNIARKFLSDKPNVTTSNKGLWSFETNLSFKEGYLGGSMICHDGEYNVQVISLDKYFADKEHVPSFIKMDIEGSELEALKGAENIIRKHKPRLAICVYHKPEDIYTLPNIINSFRDDYVFYLRHYSDASAETVLYAI